MARGLGTGDSIAGMLLTCVIASVPAACAGTDAPTAPGAPADVDSAELGLSAFITSCAVCHPPGDGFDIALFGFTRADIIRRGVAHVDSATAAYIAAYIRSLDVTPVGRDAIPFQPGTTVLSDDIAFWNDLVGTAGRLAAFTALRRMVDPRPVHRALPHQLFRDAALAVGRAPRELKVPVATFAFSYLLSWLDDNVLAPEAREWAVADVHMAFEHANHVDALPEELEPVRVMRDELLARIQ